MIHYSCHSSALETHPRVVESKEEHGHFQERIRTDGLSKSDRSPYIVWSKLLNLTKNRTLGHMLSNNALWLRATCSVRVTIFSTGGMVSNFTELHALTQAARSYALLALLRAQEFLDHVDPAG